VTAGFRVAVGFGVFVGSGVAVGLGVAVGGRVDATRVAVGGSGIRVGGTGLGVEIGGTGVAVGSTGVDVGTTDNVAWTRAVTVASKSEVGAAVTPVLATCVGAGVWMTCRVGLLRTSTPLQALQMTSSPNRLTHPMIILLAVLFPQAKVMDFIVFSSFRIR
jgi:hypothetical protein